MKKIKIIFLTIIFSFGFLNQSYSRTVPESFADLAEKLMPSVVNISTSTTVIQILIQEIYIGIVYLKNLMII